MLISYRYQFIYNHGSDIAQILHLVLLILKEINFDISNREKKNKFAMRDLLILFEKKIEINFIARKCFVLRFKHT